jgi:uncharacterized protein (DUF488 family)
MMAPAGAGAGSPARIYTVGHSNHDLDRFLALLQQHGIELLVDVRSSPYSRYVPQANRESLGRALEENGIAYRWEGDRLGGKPQGMVPDYEEMRTRPDFLQAVAELISQAEGQPTAIMCAEGDHRRCHRHMLIAPALLDQGVQVSHIQPDGTLVDETQEPQQLTFF